MTNKNLAETIHNAVWGANNNLITPFNPSEPLDWLGKVIWYGALVLLFYVSLIS